MPKFFTEIDNYIVIRCDGADGALGYVLAMKYGSHPGLFYFVRNGIFVPDIADAHSFRSAEAVVAQIELLKGAAQ